MLKRWEEFFNIISEMSALQKDTLDKTRTCVHTFWQVEPISVQANDSHVFNLPTPPRKGSLDFKLPWEYDVPQISIPGVEEQQMPVMPRLESALAKSLQSVRHNKNTATLLL